MSPDELHLTPGLQYVQFPKIVFNGIHATLTYAVEEWPGYVDTKTRDFTSDHEIRNDLLNAGWTQTSEREYWILHPPGGARDPVQKTPHDASDLAYFGIGVLAAKVTDAYPEMKSRVGRAVALVLKGNVTANHRPYTYHVKPIDNPARTYRVHIPPDRTQWACTLIQDPDSGHTHLECPDIEHAAPFLKHGKRCKHMMAAWLKRQLDKKRDASPVYETSHGAAAAPRPAPTDAKEPHSPPNSTTTPPPASNPSPSHRRLVARYADGRPARYSDGTIVRYSAGGAAVEIPPSCW